MLVLGWLTLGLGIVMGQQTARRLFGERSRLTLFFAAPALCLSLLLLTGTYLRSWFAPEMVVPLTFFLFCTGTWVMSRRPPPALLDQPVPKSVWLFLGLGLPVILLYALFEQTTGMVVDGDFFVHVASIGLFEEGHYPPLNFFLGIPTNGHFGRQLLIAQFSRFTGLEYLEADWILTSTLQMLAFALLFCLIWSHTNSVSQAALGCGFGYFGANVGSRIGLADTLANHNAVAFFMLILVTWAVLRAFEEGPLAALGAGILLGADAMVYETHFGLMGLTLPMIALVRGRGRLRESLQRMAIIGVGALVVASTTGGAITDLVRRSEGQHNAQQQQVTPRFPKLRPFYVRLDNMRPSRPFEGKMRPWGADFSPSQDYDFALGPRIRNTFWYPVWLSPLAIVYLLLKRHRVGTWFGTLALLAWLVPSLVDFGFFEGETLRWLFVSGVGGAICFGLALGAFWDRYPNRWWSVAFMALALWFGSAGLVLSVTDMARALQYPGEQLPVGRPGVVPSVGLIPRPYALLSHHYGLTQDDFEAAAWLRKNSSRQARVLSDDGAKVANYRCAMFGLEGRLPAAYLPQVEDATEPSSYRHQLQIDRFWLTGDGRLLPGIEVDWLLVHRSWHQPSTLVGLQSSPYLKLEVEIGDVQLYSCTLPAASKARPQPIEVQELTFGQVPGPGQPWRLQIRVKNQGKQDLEGLTFGFHLGDRLIGGAQTEPTTLAPGESRKLDLTLIIPHEKGMYQLLLWGGPSPGPSDGHSLGPVASGV